MVIGLYRIWSVCLKQLAQIFRKMATILGKKSDGALQKKSCEVRWLKKKKKFMQRRSEKNFMQGELHCRADQLYPTREHCAAHSRPQSRDADDDGKEQ